MPPRACTAEAGTNIALVKYWGKRDGALNLPAAGSLSLTLRELGTRTTVRFGGEYRVYRDSSANTGRSAGKLNFNTTWTLGPNSTSAASPISAPSTRTQSPAQSATPADLT